MTLQFQVSRDDLSINRLVSAPNKVLTAGQVRLSLEKFALTANNVTYAVAGDNFGYWSFFEAAEQGLENWGLIPVWGFAKVKESNCQEVPVGQIVYGYFPPAQSVVMQPAYFHKSGWQDTMAHRAELPAAYNRYTLVPPGGELDLRPLLEPLFVTSWALCDFAKENQWFGAEQIVIASASAKTSLGLAFALSKQPSAPSIVGLTSDKNLEFVSSVGIYDQILTYNDLTGLSADRPTLVIDMSGNAGLNQALEDHLGDALTRVLRVGLSHWQDSQGLGKLTREKSEVFFAPKHLESSLAARGPKDLWGEITPFLASGFDWSKSWLNVRTLKGLENMPEVFETLRQGAIAPSDGLIVAP